MSIDSARAAIRALPDDVLCQSATARVVADAHGINIADAWEVIRDQLAAREKKRRRGR